MDPDADADHHQNFTTSKLEILGQVWPSLKISAKSACNFPCNAANKPADR